MIWRFWVLAVGLTLLMGGVILLAHTTTEPIRLVVYSAEVNGNQDIYVKTIDGKSVHRLTIAPSYDFFPVWSPDGKWLAYISQRSPISSSQILPVHLMSATGTNNRIVGEIPPNVSWLQLEWSPDSQWLYVHTTNNTTQSLLINVKTGKTRILKYEYSPTWTSDSQWAFYTSTSQNPSNFETTSQIIKMSPDSEESIILLEVDYIISGSPILSPDEQWIIYHATDDTSCIHFILDINKNESRCISDTGYIPYWSFDSKWLIFILHGLNNSQLQKSRPDVSEKSTIITLPRRGVFANIIWIPYTSWIYFNLGDTICRVKEDGTEFAEITNISGLRYMTWLQEEQRLVTRSLYNDIYYTHWLNLEGNDIQLIIKTDLNSRGAYLLSPVKY